MKQRFSILIIVLAVAGGLVSAMGVRKPIQFAKGKSSAAIQGAVVRGDTDRYVITVRAGQTMKVAVTALEKNAAFTIYLPGYKTVKEDGAEYIEGDTLQGAGEGEDAMEWNGRLPVGGTYLIEVGGTRGNAEYTLTVAVQ